MAGDAEASLQPSIPFRYYLIQFFCSVVKIDLVPQSLSPSFADQAYGVVRPDICLIDGGVPRQGQGFEMTEDLQKLGYQELEDQLVGKEL